ncbi:MAG: dienelactone hydrolase family protein [Candidatus Binatia bacterium]
METRNERVVIPVDGLSMGGYVSRPAAGGPFPAVLVFMEIFGVNRHIRSVTDRLAAMGYVALAPDYFHRTAPGIELGYDEKGIGEGKKLLGKLDAEEMIADARAAHAFVNGRADVVRDRIGAIGFCIGGHMTYLAACETPLVAAASFYGGAIAADRGLGGGPSTLSRTSKIRGKILCLFGGRDAMIPPAQVDAIRAALEADRIRHEIVVYPEADHGFCCDERASYHAPSAADAWARVERLFAAELAGGS